MGSFLYYTAGAPAPIDGYPVVGQLFSGAGRLQQIFYVAEDGTKLFAAPDVFYDTVAKVDCHPQDLLMDGRLVCARYAALVSIFGSAVQGGGTFGDPACTKRLAFGGSCATAVAAQTFVDHTLPDGSTLSCPASLNRVTPHDGPIYTDGMPGPTPGPIPGACYSINLPAQTTVFDVGEPVEPDALFPPLEQVNL